MAKWGSVDFSELVGKTCERVGVINGEYGSDEIIFECADGTDYRMFHDQDCCESVYLEDICGDLGDLVGTPITMAEEATNSDGEPPDGADSSYTWTFYKLATVKGYVTIRWFGSSNGYYSEEVSFKVMNSEN